MTNSYLFLSAVIGKIENILLISNFQIVVSPAERDEEKTFLQTNNKVTATCTRCVNVIHGMANWVFFVTCAFCRGQISLEEVQHLLK